MADRFIPRNVGRRDCSDQQTWGRKSSRYDYIVKSTSGDEDYPIEACEPWVHANFQVDNMRINNSINGTGRITINGEIYSNGGAHRLSAKKNFDIPHPNKPGWRLRHTCIEGPENAIYFRGRLRDNNLIEIPSYWDGFADPDSISVHLTQIGTNQNLIVEEIDWPNGIVIKSENGNPINCYYIVYADRTDGDKLIVEYEGNDPSDYPGNNDEYSIVGWNYDVRSTTE